MSSVCSSYMRAPLWISNDLLGGGLLRRPAFDDAHDVGLLHDEELLAIDLDLGARPLAEQHEIAWLQVYGDELAALVTAARSDGDDLALHRLFLGGVWNDDAAFGLCVFLDPAHDDAVVQRTKFHEIISCYIEFGFGVPREMVRGPGLHPLVLALTSNEC